MDIEVCRNLTEEEEVEALHFSWIDVSAADTSFVCLSYDLELTFDPVSAFDQDGCNEPSTHDWFS